MLNSDYSNIGRIEIECNWFWDNIDICIPIIETSNALKNEHFKKACEYHQEMYDKLKSGDMDGLDKMEVCWDEYIEAFDDKENEIETAANFIALYYLLLIVVKSMYSISKDKPAILILAAKRNPKINDIINNHCANFDYEAKEAIDGLECPELRDLLELALTMLKHSTWDDLADYYLSIRYVFNILDNGLSPELNSRVGTEMLYSFSMVNNFYAMAFLSLLEE